MNRRLIIRPEAEADLIDAAVWYDSHELGLGLQLTAEVHSASQEPYSVLSPSYVCAEIHSSVVFSLDDFLIAFSSLIDRIV